MSHLITLVCLLAVSAAGASEVKLLPRGFAHNDYEHRRPLHDALELGFCAVEADIFATNSSLLVGHSARDLRPDRNLIDLYLEPLAQRVRSNGGKVHRGGPEFLLLIDIKTEAEPTYAALKPVLNRYRDILTSFHGVEVRTNAIRVVLSGERPIATVSNEVDRLACLDGRTVDLDSTASPSLIPLISDNWSTLFRWRGIGPISDQEKKALKSLVTRAHQQRRTFRLWAAPDVPAAWELQRELGVDWINTDKLEDFANHFRKRPD
jgi:hypothetical protein